MDLRDYLQIARRNWGMMLALTLLGVAVAGAITLTVRPTYTAETKLFVATQNTVGLSDMALGHNYAQARVQSYIETAETPAVLTPVAESLGMSPGQLAGSITASAAPGTVIISIVASDASPIQAAAIAQSVGESLISAVEELESPADGGPSPVKLSVIAPAEPPVSPSAPKRTQYILVGAFAGLLGGAAIALLRTVLNTKVRGERELRRITDVPLLGGLVFDKDAVKKPLLTQSPAQSPRAEAFRQLRTNLQFSHVSHDTKAVLFTSSLPEEGKTTTAVNLAIAIAQSGQSVALIDADLRRPRIHEYLGLDAAAGLTTALVGRASVMDLLQPWGEHELYVLTSGQIPPNPSELVGSRAMEELIGQLESRFDAVIIDAPPLLPVTDAAVLARKVGGVMLVVGASKVTTPQVEKSLTALEMVDADLLGIVMNLLPSKGPDAYSYDYYSTDLNVAPVKTKSRGRLRQQKVHDGSTSEFDKRVIQGEPPVRTDRG